MKRAVMSSVVSVFGLILTAQASADGVEVGSSSLIGELDYSDTFSFTGPPGSTPSSANPRPEGYSGSNAFGAYNVENTYGNPASVWEGSPFTFAGPATAVGHTGATGNPGAVTGFAQNGSGDSAMTYGSLRDNFVVQFDAIMPNTPGRLDINLFVNASDTISANGAMSLFIRRGGSIDLFRPGLGDQPTGADTSVIDDFNWHNFAVWFNGPEDEISIYIDEVLQTTIDTTTFAGGAFQNYSTNAIGFGSENLNGGQLTKVDNFQVGAPIPAPGAAVLLSAGILGMGCRRQRR